MSPGRGTLPRETLVHAPSPPGPTAAPPPLPPPPRRRRKWPVILGIVLAVIVGLTFIGFVMDETVLTHNLLEEDFEDGPGVFHLERTSTSGTEVSGGTLRIRTLGRREMAGAGGGFSRKAWAVNATADVVAIEGGGDDMVMISIAIGQPGDAYGFTVGTHGYGLEIARSGAGNRVLAEDLDTVVEAGSIRRIELRVVNAPNGESVKIAAWLNGEQVLEAEDPDGIDGFTSMVLAVYSVQAGAEVTFDNARAFVP